MIVLLDGTTIKLIDLASNDEEDDHTMLPTIVCPIANPQQTIIASCWRLKATMCATTITPDMESKVTIACKQTRQVSQHKCGLQFELQ